MVNIYVCTCLVYTIYDIGYMKGIAIYSIEIYVLYKNIYDIHLT